MVLLRKVAALLAAVSSAVALTAAPATAQPQAAKGRAPGGVHVVADGLNGPRQLFRRGGRLYVTEADAGQVTRVNLRTGRTRAVVTGLGENAPAGAVRIGGRYVIVTAEAGEEAGPQPGSSVLVARPGRSPRRLADLLAYELAKNPDGQRQFDANRAPIETLANPYFVLPDRSRRGYVLVADAGANAVLRVSRTGRVSRFFVPRNVNTGACAGQENNDPQHPGCDPVPTGLAYGPGNTLYISALVAEVPGEGRVYVVNATTGRLKRVIRGLSGPTGVAVDRRTGTVYVSELLEGAPQEEPGPGFDPSAVGQIVRIAPNGRRAYAQVTMPSGLLFTGGKLYASAWSIAGFLGMSDAGQVVKVSDRAFRRAS